MRDGQIVSIAAGACNVPAPNEQRFMSRVDRDPSSRCWRSSHQSDLCGHRRRFPNLRLQAELPKT